MLQLQNYLQKKVQKHSVHAAHAVVIGMEGERIGEDGLAGGIFADVFNEFRGETGFFRDLLDQLLVVIGNIQLFGDLLADGAAGAAKLSADGNDLFFHGNPSLGQLTIIKIPHQKEICQHFCELKKEESIASAAVFCYDKDTKQLSRKKIRPTLMEVLR